MRRLYPLAGALTVIGGKCWMIRAYGNPLPFWDQWDAEGALLFPKYLNGNLQAADLIAAHNEHRVLLTRLWSLSLFALEGYWDAIAQMLANTLPLGGFVALMIVSFRPVLNGTAWIAFALFAAAIYTLPLGWESTLNGFNSQWYFMLLFGLAGLMAIVDAVAFSPRWWMAVLFVVVGYFGMAGGALAAAAAFVACALQVALGRRSGAKELAALGVLAALTAAMIAGTPVLPDPLPYRAQSAGQFVQALLKILGWPLVHSAAVAVFALGAVLVHLPTLATCVRVWARRPPCSDPRWRLIALAVWFALQAAAIAYGRAANPMSARYLDVFAVGVLVDAACLLYWLSHTAHRRRLACATIVWTTLLIAGLFTYVLRHTVPEIAEQTNAIPDQIASLRAFLESGDIRTLENKPPRHISYPDPQRLARVASDPSIRAILPPELVGEASVARAQQRGLARYTGRAVTSLKHLALRWGFLLLPAGLVLFALGATLPRRRRLTSPGTP